MELEIRPETVTALSLVPLVEVAWADGSLDASERRAILERPGVRALRPGSIELALLETWLTRRPERNLFAAWRHFVQGLPEQLSRDERDALRDALLADARAVASAAGGFLGVGKKISADEARVVQALESAFTDARPGT